MTIPKLRPGHKRQWVKCRTCGNVSYYDYVPYSLSNPIMTTPCGHGIGERDMGCDHVSATEAQAALRASAVEREQAMNSKPVNRPEQLIANLLRLKEELWNKYGGDSGVGAAIAMKLNSCLYGVYPPEAERLPAGVVLQKVGSRPSGLEVNSLWSREVPGRGRRTLWVDPDYKLYLSTRAAFNHGEPEPDPVWYRITIGTEDMS